MSNDLLEICAEQYARRNEDIHIHMSSELPCYNGVLHSFDCMQFICVLSGKATYRFGEKTYLAQKGDFLLINREIPFIYTEFDNESDPFLFYTVMYNHAVFSRSATATYPSKLMASSFAFYAINDKDITPYLFFKFSNVSNSMYGEFFNKMYMEYKNAKNGYNDALLAYLTLIIINAVRHNEALGNTEGKVYSKHAVAYVQDYINRCYCDKNISVAGLADRVYLNTDYLGRIFKKATGNTITAALQKKRITHVCHLLTTTDRAINDIADACGFNDMHFFYKVFKQRMGVLPGEYRDKTKI